MKKSEQKKTPSRIQILISTMAVACFIDVVKKKNAPRMAKKKIEGMLLSLTKSKEGRAVLKRLDEAIDTAKKGGKQE